MTPMSQSIARSTLGLGLFAVITAGLIAFTQQSTESRIAEAVTRARSQALFQVFPPTRLDNDLLNDTLTLPANPAFGYPEAVTVHVARYGEQPVGFIFPATAAEGYTGPIKLLVGIDTLGEVTGVRVTEHRETPGLGDKIETRKSDWILGFDGRALGDPPKDQWAVKKDGGAFDQLTGATITPRAVVKAVRHTLHYYAEARERLLTLAQPSEDARP